MFNNHSNPFEQSGMWLRANLHCHSTNSDGSKTPQGLLDVYYDRGYDVLAITDHNVITLSDGLDDHGMVVIPAVEYDVGQPEIGESFHFVVLNLRNQPWKDGEPTVDRVMCLLEDPERFVFLAHPYWSSLSVTDVLPIGGIEALEVINWSTHYQQGIGISAVHWDDLLSRGRKLWGLGVDDSHFLGIEDAFGGWTMVRTADLTVDGVIQALRAGWFYATMGPEIHDIRFENHRVSVECSPAQAVHVLCDRHLGSSRWAEPGDTIERVLLEFHPDALYARIEIVDADGRCAWSNPFFFRNAFQ